MLLYFMSFLDRYVSLLAQECRRQRADQKSSVNISNALTLGLQKDLKLKGIEANTCLALFYVPYFSFEIPSNYLLKRLKPQVWRMYYSPAFKSGLPLTSPVSCCMVSYGIVMLCHGFGISAFHSVRMLKTRADQNPSPKLQWPPGRTLLPRSHRMRHPTR